MAEALVDLDPAGARAPRSAKPCSFNMKAPERVPSRAPTPKPLPLGYGEARLTIGPGRIRDKFSSKPFVPELQTTFQPPPRQSMPWPKPARAGRSHLSRSSRAIAGSTTTRRALAVAITVWYESRTRDKGAYVIGFATSPEPDSSPPPPIVKDERSTRASPRFRGRWQSKKLGKTQHHGLVD